jgi:hypothetical protein
MSESELEPKRTGDDAWGDLVISILSVNQYSLERTYRSLVGLSDQGLVSPENLMRWEPSEIVNRLKSAGFDRGQFMTNLFALRLAALGTLIEAKGLEACTKVISAGDARVVEELLPPVNGIGPKVDLRVYAREGAIPRRRGRMATI